MFRVIRRNGEALELERRESLVQAVEQRRHTREELLTECQIIAGKAAVGALR